MIERVAIECQVRKSCAVMQHFENRSVSKAEVHTYRIVVGVEEGWKKEEKKERKARVDDEGEEEEEKEEQQHSPPTSNNRPTLTITFEADLSTACACHLRAAAALFPPLRSSSPSPRRTAAAAAA